MNNAFYKINMSLIRLLGGKICKCLKSSHYFVTTLILSVPKAIVNKRKAIIKNISTYTISASISLVLILYFWWILSTYTKNGKNNHLLTLLFDCHLGINKHSPEGRTVQTEGKKIDKIPLVNGLHHVYFRKAA